MNPIHRGDEIEIPAGGTLTFEIKATLDRNLLRLPPESYRLAAEVSYELHVRHAGIASNPIVFTLADFGII